jgi:hypothetical protein
MDFETVAGNVMGPALRGLGLNLLVRDMPAEAAFLAAVFGMAAHRVGRDFAVMVYRGQPLQLHSDAAFAGHALAPLLPAAGPRGAGAELRLYDSDPDAAVAAAAAFPDALVLAPPRDKPGHGLREAVILSPAGYAWVPSRPAG